MDLAKLKALIDLVAASRISELEIVEGQERIRITRDVAPPRTQPSAPMAAPVVVEAQPQPAATASEPPPGDAVLAPMYGVFHRAPAPGAPPFVELGQRIEQGQTVGIIEAMKAFNAVAAERAGTVAAILVESGQEVEHGQPLLRIE